MIIKELNGKIINSKNVYLHDDILRSLKFDYSNKTLQLIIEKSISSECYTIDFYKVIDFSMTSCSFWGPPETILDFKYIEPTERVLIPKIRQEALNFPKSHLNYDLDNYLEILFTFASGDNLRIACVEIKIK